MWLCTHLRERERKSYFKRQMKRNYWGASSSLYQCCPPFSVSVHGNIQDSKVSYVTLYQPSSVLEAANCGFSLGNESCWNILVLQIILKRHFLWGLIYATYVGNVSKVTQWGRESLFLKSLPWRTWARNKEGREQECACWAVTLCGRAQEKKSMLLLCSTSPLP